MLLEDVKSLLLAIAPLLDQDDGPSAGDVRRMLQRIEKTLDHDQPGKRQLLAKLVEYYDQDPSLVPENSYEEFAHTHGAPSAGVMKAIMLKLRDDGIIDGDLGAFRGSLKLTSFGRQWCKEEHGL